MQIFALEVYRTSDCEFMQMGGQVSEWIVPFKSTTAYAMQKHFA